MRAGLSVDELGVDADTVLVALHRALQHIAYAKLLADLLGVDCLALVGEGSVARDDETVADARQISRDVFGDTVGEIVLARSAREVCERQHDDGKMRGLGGHWRGRDNGRDSGPAQEIPKPASDQDE